MKHRFAITLLLCALFVNGSKLFAATPDSMVTSTSQLLMGIKAGVVISDIVGSASTGGSYTFGNSAESNMLLSYSVGISAAYPLSNKLMIQGEVLYSQMGVVEYITLLDDNQNYQNVESITRLNYFQFPIAVRLGKTIRANRIMPFFEAGGLLGFMTKGYATLKPYGSSTYKPTTIQFSTLENVDIGVMGGVGFEYPLQSVTVSLGLRYYYGITPILSVYVPYLSTLTTVRYRNQGIFIQVGMTF